MGIIQTNTPVLPGDQIRADMNAAFRFNLATYQRNMQRLWEHPKYTPQEVCDQLGADAAEAFQRASDLAALLNKAKPGTIDTSNTPAFTVNNDGTVTIGTPSTSSSSAS